MRRRNWAHLPSNVWQCHYFRCLCVELSCLLGFIIFAKELHRLTILLQTQPQSVRSWSFLSNLWHRQLCRFTLSHELILMHLSTLCSSLPILLQPQSVRRKNLAHFPSNVWQCHYFRCLCVELSSLLGFIIFAKVVPRLTILLQTQSVRRRNFLGGDFSPSFSAPTATISSHKPSCMHQMYLFLGFLT